MPRRMNGAVKRAINRLVKYVAANPQHNRHDSDAATLASALCLSDPSVIAGKAPPVRYQHSLRSTPDAHHDGDAEARQDGPGERHSQEIDALVKTTSDSKKPGFDGTAG